MGRTLLSGRWRLLTTACGLAAVLAVSPSANVPAQDATVASSSLIDRFLAPDRPPLVSYRALRHLTASTRGGRMQASVDAWTAFDPAQGFSYEVTAAAGSDLIRRRVLIAALEAEHSTARGADTPRMALTRDNYDFLGVTDDAGNLSKIGIRPRHKRATLINGALFVEEETADLVRVEGEPTERPSFWTRHVRIVREYGRVSGVNVPIAMSSTADVLVVGASNFSMTYRYTHVNGSPVAE